MDKKEQLILKERLKKAGNLIAKSNEFNEKGYHCICDAMENLGFSQKKWQKLPSAKMIDPGYSVWWGVASMGQLAYCPIPRSARLLGIAMMLTMPDDMIDPKFLK